MGEETGGDIHEKEFWIIDPVDGTRSFARGIPTWCVIVSFAKDKEIVATAIYYPYNDIVYYAEKGKGAFKNDKRISVSHVADIKNAYMGYGSPKHFENKQVVIDLINAAASSRSWEATFSGCMVAEGKMDGTVDSYGRVWDLAPFKLLIEEAGGEITRMNGDEWTFEGYGAVLSNGKIHDQVIEILNKKD